MKKVLLAALLLSACGLSAHATKLDHAILVCTTTNGKTLWVSNNNAKITYSLINRKCKEDLGFTTPHAQVKYRPWDGVGRHMNHVLTLPRGQYSYVVFTSGDKHSDTHETGVRVSKNDKRIATLRCHNDKIRVNELENLTGITTFSQ